MKRAISQILAAVLLLSSITYAQDREGWTVSTKKDGYLGRIRMESDGLWLELADGQVFHSATMKGWEDIKVNHPEIMPLVDGGIDQLAPNLQTLAIGAMLDMSDWGFMESDFDEPDWNYYLSETDPSAGGGGFVDPYQQERCRIAHNVTTAAVAAASLMYIRLLAVCGSIAIPVLGEVTAWGCLFQLGVHLVALYTMKNAKDAEVLACRGY